MEGEIPQRYESNPMLVVVENYVLDALGLLEPDKERQLRDIVCRTFGGEDWRATVRSQFGLPADSAKQLRQLWKQRQEEADAKQDEVSVEDFAREVADGIFQDMG